MTKEFLSYHGIRTAKYKLFKKSDEIILPNYLSYPVIVKPNGEGSSKGIDIKSVAKNEKEL